MEKKVKVLFLTFVLIVSSLTAAAPVGTAFTYQGRLLDANLVADGLYDFQFRLYDSIIDGNQVGIDVNVPNMDVIDGYFTALLDFTDANAFNGDSRWLEIGVRPGTLNDPNAYSYLSPRQQVTAAPYAGYACSAKIANTTVAGGYPETDPTVASSVKDGVDWTELTSRPAGLDDGDDVGLIAETDPTVNANVKDGVSWDELAAIPAGFADGNDDAGDTDWTIDGNDMYASASGNIGIGISNPTVKLHVAGDLLISDENSVLTDEFDYWEDQSSHSYTTEGQCIWGAYPCGDDDALRVGNCFTGTGAASITVSVVPGTDTITLLYKSKIGNGLLYVDDVYHGGLSSDYGCDWIEKTVTGIAAHTADGQVVIKIADETLGCDGDLQITYIKVYSHIPAAMFVDSDSGKVGIGTTNPAEKLDVAGIAQVTGFKMPTNANNGYVLTSDSTGTGTWQQAKNVIDGGGTANYITKFSDANTLTDSMIYQNTDSIGIGTVSPAAVLNVSNAGPDDSFRVDSTSGYMSPFVVDENGNVGIGTTNPSAHLQIYEGTARIEPKTYNENTHGSGLLLNAYYANISYGYRRYADIVALGDQDGNRGGGILRFLTNDRNDPNAIERMRVERNGNVGIGTDSPARTLHVKDVMRLQPRASAPSSPSEGDMYMDSTTHKLMVYDGSDWRACW